MTERAELGLVFENRHRHENDHALAGGISVLPLVLRLGLPLVLRLGLPLVLRLGLRLGRTWTTGPAMGAGPVATGHGQADG
jgi:hypothetical protein